MANPYFQFKQFTVFHDRCAMKVTTDACVFGAWTARILKEARPGESVLDIGTGSGLLSLMAAQQTEGPIDAVEIDAAAAGQAAANVAASPWAGRIRIINDNVLALDRDRRWGCILSNPPFYERELASPDAGRNAAHHGTMLSIREVLTFISDHLEEEGEFFLLFPYKRKEEVQALIAAVSLYVMEMVTVQPSVSHAPFRLMIRGSGRPGRTTVQQTLSIRNEAGNYTEAFIALLRPYYLHLQHNP